MPRKKRGELRAWLQREQEAQQAEVRSPKTSASTLPLSSCVCPLGLQGRFIKAEDAADLLAASTALSPGEPDSSNIDSQPGSPSDDACTTAAAALAI